MEQFDFFDAGSYTPNDRWKEIIEPHLRKSKSFEIHCCNEEKEAIRQALSFGKMKDQGQYETVIAGEVTGAFIRCILSAAKPADTEIYNKMTPFFSIFLDDGFSSEHYGTELNQL